MKQNALLRLSQWLVLLTPLLIYWGKAPTDIAISTVAVFFLLHSILNNEFSWLHKRWLQLFLIFWVYILLRSLFTEETTSSIARAAPFIRYPMFAAALAYWVIQDHAFIRKVWMSLTLSILLLSLDALLQYLSGTSLTGNAKFTEYRLTGPYSQPRIGYTICWMIMPVLGGLIYYYKETKWKWLALFAGVLPILAIILSGERSPALLLLLGLAGLLVTVRSFRKRLLWLLPLTIALIAALLYFNPVIYERQVVSTIDTIQSLEETPYGQIFLDAEETIERNPVFGVGPKQYRVVCAKPELNYRNCQQHPHNFYLELWAETGIIGLLMIMAGLFFMLKELIQGTRLMPQHALLISIIIGVMVRFWPIIANPSFFESWNVIPMWLMIGLGLAICRLKKQIK